MVTVLILNLKNNLLDRQEENITKYFMFCSAIEHYNDLYQKGLKKQANTYLKDFAAKIKTLDEVEQDDIFYHFISDLCDYDRYDFLKERDNGKIPFALEQSVKNWLYSRCIAGKMPKLRWFFKLFRNDRFESYCDEAGITFSCCKTSYYESE